MRVAVPGESRNEGLATSKVTDSIPKALHGARAVVTPEDTGGAFLASGTCSS